MSTRQARTAARRRVVVTGMGVVSPIGNSVAEAWESAREGRSGIADFTHLDVAELPVRFGGAVRDFPLERYMSRREARTMDSFIQYAIAAGVDAWQDSGLPEADAEQPLARVGVAVGSGIGGLPMIERTVQVCDRAGTRRISPFFVPASIINMAAGQLSMRLRLAGPGFSVVSACATGSHNIGLAARLVQWGEVEVMLAGGCEMSSCKTCIGGFAQAHALSVRNDEPSMASRPWDRGRDGFVLGDGAGVLVLEEYEHAQRRDARIYAEFRGFGMSADAYHITAPRPDGSGIVTAMRLALQDAGLAPEELSYINAHATSTPAGDLAESRGIHAVFGDHAARLAVSSTKSVHGHLLGAAGGLEAILTIQALHNQVAPPTINLDDPEPECALDYVPHTARDWPMQAAMSNSFGFGGTNVALVFSRPA